MKQMEPRIATVGDNTFYIRPLPAFKAANLTGELAALVLPLVSGLAPLLDKVDSSKEGGGLMDLDVSEAAPAISGAFSSISGDKVEAILKHLLIAGKNIAFETPEDDKAKVLTEDIANELFCEDVQDMFLLAFEVIRTHYNGFFKKLGARFGPLIEAMTKTATPRQESTASLT